MYFFLLSRRVDEIFPCDSYSPYYSYLHELFYYTISGFQIIESFILHISMLFFNRSDKDYEMKDHIKKFERVFGTGIVDNDIYIYRLSWYYLVTSLIGLTFKYLVEIYILNIIITYSVLLVCLLVLMFISIKGKNMYY